MAFDQAIYSIDRWAQQWQPEHAEKVPGLVICLHNDDGIHYSQSFGVPLIAPNQTLEANPLLPIASISKTFTALSVLQLIHEGKKHPLTGRELNLDDRITDLLPQLKTDWMEGVNLRDALEHRTRIGHISDEWMMSSEQLREKGLTGVEPDNQIGYSNRMYNWLGILVEDVSGMKFHQYIEREIVQRHNLGEIYSSYHVIPEHERLQIPTGRLTNDLISAADPCGGFYAKPEALADFFSKLARGHILPEHAATIDAVTGMFKARHGKGMGTFTAYFDDANAYGDVNPYKVAGVLSNPLGDLFGHTGGTYLLRGDVRYNPLTGVTAAVFMIGIENNSPISTADVISRVFQEILQTPVREPERLNGYSVVRQSGKAAQAQY